MLSFSLLPLLYWSNEIPEYLYKVLCCSRREKISLTTKMNHNEIKKSLSFPFDAAMDWQHARRGPCLRLMSAAPNYIYHHYFFHMFLYHVHNRKFGVNLQFMTKLFHRNTEQFRCLVWHHTHIVQELSAILDLIQSPAAMEKSGGYWL